MIHEKSLKKSWYIMNCEKVTELIDFYIEGELGQDVMNNLNQHFKSCDTCSEELQKYKQLFSVIEDINTDIVQMPEDFTSQVMKKLPASKKVSPVQNIIELFRKFMIPISTAAIIILVVFIIFQNTEKKSQKTAYITIDQTAVLKQEQPIKIASLQLLSEGPFQINRKGTMVSGSEKKREQIFKNDRLITENAKLKVKYDSRRQIVIGKNSELTFFKDRIALHTGAIRVKVRSTGAIFSVKTDNAIIKVTGTDFIVIHNNMHETVVSLLSGNLNIFNNSNSVNITAGQKAIIKNPFDNIIVQILKEMKKIKISKKTKTDTCESSTAFPVDTVKTYDDIYDQFDDSTLGAGRRIR